VPPHERRRVSLPQETRVQIQSTLDDVASDIRQALGSGVGAGARVLRVRRRVLSVLVMVMLLLALFGQRRREGGGRQGARPQAAERA
jgi:hypothetical protein